jgi:hypothetical protein
MTYLYDNLSPLYIAMSITEALQEKCFFTPRHWFLRIERYNNKNSWTAETVEYRIGFIDDFGSLVNCKIHYGKLSPI